MTQNSVEDRLGLIYDDLEANVVKIANRRELIMAVDLVYHSARAFYFQGRKVEKGAMELLCVGDTRTGKTSTIKAIMRHYNAGDFIQGEAVSMAGLLAGVDEANKRRFVRAGRLPLSHRRLVTIDEANEMDREIIGKLSGVRSSGILDIVKINSARMACLVRQIWIGNTRGSKTLAAHAYGIEAVLDLIGKPEDVARFDLVIGYSESDVDVDALYRPSRDWEKKDHKYTSELCAKMVRWAWSRSAPNIVIEDETEDAVLEVAKQLCAEFDPTIPLLIASEARIKVAKVATAIAIRLLSTDDQFEKVIVKPEHAVAAGWAMRSIFNVPSLAYGEWSRARGYGVNGSAHDKLGDGVEKVFIALGKKGAAAALRPETVSRFGLEQIFGDRDAAERAIQIMILEGALQQHGRKMMFSSEAVHKLRSIVNSTNGLWEELPRPSMLRTSYYPGQEEIVYEDDEEF